MDSSPARIGAEPEAPTQAADRSECLAAAAVPRRLAAGDTISRYRILEALGAGAMGEVFVAEDLELGRKVALKVLPAELAARPQRLARFQREARAVAALSHRNIVTLHSIEAAEGLHFMTMELVEGETLDRLISPQGIPLSGLLPLAIPLAEALAAAHGQGVVHRDLKPSNVMVDREGRIKVLDFGLAKVAREPEPPLAPTATVAADCDLSRAGTVLGTVPYMSPEQAQGRPVDHRSDIFSLGVLLYEMASGQHPFPGDSAAARISSIVGETPPSVTELRQDLPPELERIIGRCLEKDPADRFSSALELRSELRALRQDLTSKALRSELGRLHARFPSAAAHPRRRRASAHSPALVGAALVTVLAAAPVGTPTGRLAAHPQPPAARVASTIALPCQLEGSASHGHLAAAVAAILSSGLTQVTGLATKAPPSSLEVERGDLARLAATYSVASLVLSSLVVVEDRVLLTVQLVESDTRTLLWSRQLEGDADRTFDLARQAAQELRQWLQPAPVAG